MYHIIYCTISAIVGAYQTHSTLRPCVSTLLLVETLGFPRFSLWLWGNESRNIFCLASFLVVFSGNRRFSRGFGLLKKMVIFGDEDNMVERFAEIDARVFS